MATNYPGSLDNFTNPTSASPINSPSHADQHSNANDAIEAIEGELGTNPKGAKATVKARLDDVDTAIATKAPIASPTFTGTVTIPAGSAITGVPYLATANNFTAAQSISGSVASANQLIVFGASGQSVPYFQVRNSGNTVVFNVTNSNSLIVQYGSITTGTGTSLGQITSVPGNATTIGLVIRGATSQTANLQEWQNSAGTVLINVNSAGDFSANSSLTQAVRFRYLDNPNIDGAYIDTRLVAGTLGVVARSTTATTFIVRGAASQTANLQEWQDSTGAVNAFINSSAQFAANRITAGSTTVQTSARLSSVGGITTDVILGLRGAASATGDYVRMFTSAGVVMGGYNALAQSFTGSTAPILVATGGATTAASGDGTTATITTTSAHGLAVGDLITIAGVTPAGYNATAILTAVTSTTISYLNATTGAQTVAGTVSAPAQASITARSSGTVTLAVSGGGVVPIQQWLSGSTVQSEIRNSGQYRSALGAIFGSITGTTQALVQIFSTTASLVSFGINATTSQTANLTEWRDSSGTVLAKIQSTGAFNSSWAGTFGTLSNLSSTTLGVVALNSTIVPLVVKGAASQTANLQEWQDSAGTVLAKVNNNGVLHTFAAVYTPYIQPASPTGVNAFIALDNTTVLVDGWSASTVKLTVKGYASQTANLQEWKNSAGTVLGSLGSSGVFTSAKDVWHLSTDSRQRLLYAGDGASIYKTYTSHDWRNASDVLTNRFDANGGQQNLIQAATTVGLIVKGATSQTANLTEWQNSAGTVFSYVTAVGTISIPRTSHYSFNNGVGAERANISSNSSNELALSTASGLVATFSSLGTTATLLSNIAAAPAAVVLTVKGTTSQTGDLQQWQNSAGTVLAKIASDGGITTPNIGLATYGGIYGVGSYMVFNPADTRIVSTGLSVGGTSVGASAQLQVTNNVAGTTAMIVKGAASQTANLTEWQNSSGTVLAKVTAAGDINIDISQGGTFHAQASGGQVGDYNLIKMSQVSTQKTTLLTTVVSGGNTEFSVKTLIGTLTTTLKIDKDSLVGIGKDNTSPLAQIDVRPQSASTIGAIIRGAASQSANLQEWQSSSGEVGMLFNMGNAGDPSTLGFSVSRAWGIKWGAEKILSTDGGSLIVTPYTTDRKVLIVKGVASQTANLQEWQNSSGAVLAAINPVGQFFTGSVPFYTTASTTTAASGNGTTATITTTSAHNIAVGDFISVSGITPAGYNGTYLVTAVPTSTQISYANTTTGSQTVAGSILISAQATITARSNMSIGLTVKAGANAPAQTWQNSLGAQVARVDNTGNIVVAEVIASNLIAPFGYALIGTSYSRFSTAMISVASTTAASQGIIVRGAASQTASLQQWQDSAGNVLASVNPNGFLQSSVGFASTTSGQTIIRPSFDTGAIVVVTQNPAHKALVVRGTASQTADLQQWQDSSGTALSRVAPKGNIYVGVTQAGLSGQINGSGVVTQNTSPLFVRGTQSGQNLIELWAYGKDAFITGAVGNGTSVTYTTSIEHGFTTSDYVIINGISYSGGSGNLNIPGGNTVSAVTTYTFTVPNTSTQTYVSGGYVRNAEYPASILQAYRSDGMSLFTIGGSGGFAMSDVMSVSGTGYQQAGLSIQPNLTSSAAIRAYGRSAQSAEILDIRNYIYKSGGNESIFAIVPDYSVSANADGYSAWVRMKNAATPTVNPTSAGYLYVGSGALNYMGTSNVPQQIVGADGSVKFTSPAVATAGLIVKGLSSQTANLQEWQNSNGNIVARVKPDGLIESYAGLYSYTLGSSSDGSLVATMGSNGNISFSGTVTAPTIKSSASSTISANTATTVDTVALSSFTTIEYTISIKQGSKVRSSKVLVHTDGTSVDSTEYGIIEMGGGITGILVTASVSSTNSILQVTITDAATTNATVKLIKTML